MASQIAGSTLRNAVYGIKVERAAAALPQTATGNLFQILNGRVLVTALVGEITTAVQAQATTIKLNALASTPNTNADMCATVDLNAAAVGQLLGITGVLATAMTLGPFVPQPNEQVFAPGFIRAITGASSTGAVKWTLTYIPIDDGASVAAV